MNIKIPLLSYIVFVFFFGDDDANLNDVRVPFSKTKNRLMSFYPFCLSVNQNLSCRHIPANSSSSSC